MSGWRAELDAVDAALIDGYQSGFPLEPRPFRAVGEALGVSAAEALDRVRRLADDGVFRRFGPVLNPPVIGSSTLAALSVPAGRFDEVAAVVNGHRQVNHNYRRDHEWNMWFVVTAGSRERRDAVIADVAERTGLDPLVLPMRTDYYIDLEFPVVNADGLAGEGAAGGPADRASTADRVAPTDIAATPAADLTPLEADLLLAVQDGMPLTATPYADVAATVGTDAGTVVETLAGLRERNCVKRVGCVVNHVRTGFDANCMVVWDVPDGDLDDRGAAVGGLPYVTLCYHRPRRPERDWPYNLFTMVHGRERDRVAAAVDELAATELPYDHERLFSTETLKQTGARYEALLSTADAAADD
ncbi:MAG: Lrp/AsnC family transcriptional regulator [Halobacteriaceae archaeon]